MSKIKHENTNPELLVRKYLFSQGFRYRTNVRSLPGSPDIVLKKYKTAIFIHGCFWHGHSCRAGRRPQSNEAYWIPKLDANIARDRQKNLGIRRSRMESTRGLAMRNQYYCEKRKKVAGITY